MNFSSSVFPDNTWVNLNYIFFLGNYFPTDIVHVMI